VRSDEQAIVLLINCNCNCRLQIVRCKWTKVVSWWTSDVVTCCSQTACVIPATIHMINRALAKLSHPSNLSTSQFLLVHHWRVLISVPLLVSNIGNAYSLEISCVLVVTMEEIWCMFHSGNWMKHFVCCLFFTSIHCTLTDTHMTFVWQHISEKSFVLLPK